MQNQFANIFCQTNWRFGQYYKQVLRKSTTTYSNCIQIFCFRWTFQCMYVRNHTTNSCYRIGQHSRFFFKGFFRQKHKLASVHNRRYNLLRRILPHYIYLSIMLIFAHFHGQLTDLLLLLITCPVIFWNFVFLLQKRVNMNQMDQFGLVTNWIKIFSKQNFNISVIFVIVISIRPLCNALTHIIARQVFGQEVCGTTQDYLPVPRITSLGRFRLGF